MLKVFEFKTNERDECIRGAAKLLADIELKCACDEHPLFADNAHAYGVIKEELEEVREEMRHFERKFDKFWKLVRKDAPIEEVAKTMKFYVANAVYEGIQLMAMCQKAIDSEQAREQAQTELEAEESEDKPDDATCDGGECSEGEGNICCRDCYKRFDCKEACEGDGDLDDPCEWRQENE